MKEVGFLLLATTIFVGLYIHLGRYKKQNAVLHYASENTPKGFFEVSWIGFYAKAVCLIVSWALLSIAMIEPLEMHKESSLKAFAAAPVQEVIFVLDASASMNAEDASLSASKQTSRFYRAKEIIEQIVEKLAGVNVTLIAFSGAPELLVPPTQDYLYFRILLDGCRINEPEVTGSNFLALFDFLGKCYGSHNREKSKTIIFLTDGEDTSISDVDEITRKNIEESIYEKAKELSSMSWEVVAIGNQKGAVVPGLLYQGAPVVSYMNKPFLKRFAEEMGGHFFEEASDSLLSIVDAIDSRFVFDVVPQQLPHSSQSMTKRGFIPLLASFFFILIALFLPAGRKKR